MAFDVPIKNPMRPRSHLPLGPYSSSEATLRVLIASIKMPSSFVPVPMEVWLRWVMALGFSW